MSKERVETLLCVCGLVEHQIIFQWVDNWQEVFMSVHLTKLGFWRRLIYGIKYIFGYQCRYGAFEEVILNSGDWRKLQKVVDRLKELEEKENEQD